MDSKLMQYAGIGVVFGLVVGGGSVWFSSRSKSQAVGQKAACFLSGGGTDKVLGTVEGKTITTGNLPENLQANMMQAEAEHNRRITDLVNEAAVRYLAAKEQGKSVSIEQLPTLKDLVGAEVTKEDVRKFFDSNKNSFPKMNFEQVEPMLRRHLEQQKQNTFLQSHLADLKKNSALKVQIPISCGPKASVEPPAGAIVRGKGSRFELVFVSDYQCGPCRYMKPALDTLADLFSDSMKFVQVMYTGEKKGSSNDYLVRGTYCAKNIADNAKYLSYNATAYFSNVKYDSAGKVVEEGDPKKAAMDAAKRVTLDAAAFSKCLESKDAENYADTNRKYFADLRLDQAPAFYLNGRRLAVPPQLNIAELMQEIMEDSGAKAAAQAPVAK